MRCSHLIDAICIPPGHNRAQRKTVLWRKVVAIHLIREQHVVARFCQRNARAQISHSPGGASSDRQAFPRRAPSKNYFARFGFYFSAIEQDRQRNTSPFGRADSAEVAIAHLLPSARENSDCSQHIRASLESSATLI